MSALKEQLIDYIQDIPDYKLEPIAPLLKMLSDDIMIIEKVNFDDLTDEEREAVAQSREELRRGETVSLEDYMQSRDISV